MAQAIDPALLVPIAEKYGIDPQAFIRAAQIESSLGATPDTPGSQYQGLFQLGADEARRWGGLDVHDPLQNAEMAAKGWSTELVPQLTASLGREPTWGEVYLAHQQGVGGATQMIAHPNAPAASGPVTRAAVSGNIPGNLRGQYDPSTITGRQFADIWTSRFGDPVSAQPPSTNPTPGNLGIPDILGALGGQGPQSTAGLYASAGLPNGAFQWDTPPVNAQSGLGLDQINGMLGDLSGGLGLLPSGPYAVPTYDALTPPVAPATAPTGTYSPVGTGDALSALSPGQTVTGVDGGFAPDALGVGELQPNQPGTGIPSPAPGSVNAFTMPAPAASADPFLPIPGYTGPTPGADSFQRYDVPSFPQGSDQVASGYDPSNPPDHGTDTSNLYAFQLPGIFGGNSPGANAEPQYPPDPSQNWRDPSTGTYIFGSNAISSLASAAQKASDTGQDPMKAVYDDSYTSAPDSHIGDFKQLGKDVEAGQNLGKAASDIASNPLWSSLGSAASDIGEMLGPFTGSGQTQMAAASPASIYSGAPTAFAASEKPAGVDAVNGMAAGGFGMPLPDSALFGSAPTASTFNGFSPLGEPFDPKADPFAPKSPSGSTGVGTYQAPQSPASSFQAPGVSGFTLPAGPGGWASFGSGTIGGQPWSTGSQMPGLFPQAQPQQKTREFVPQPGALFGPSTPSAPSYATPSPPPSQAYQTAMQVYGDQGTMNQSQGNPGGFSFDPGSFSNQDAESLASALTSYGW